MKTVSIKTAGKITAWIMLPVEMIYCILCAILITLPLYLALNILWMLFSTPQVEKPTAAEISEAEDEVLNEGGAFANFSGFLR